MISDGRRRSRLNVQRRQLYLLCEVMRDWKIAVACHKHPADHEHRVVRRRYPLHLARYLSLPAWPRHEKVTRFRTGGTFANVRKTCVLRWVCELHAVVTTGHIGYMQDQRDF